MIDRLAVLAISAQRFPSLDGNHLVQANADRPLAIGARLRTLAQGKAAGKSNGSLR